MRYLLFLPILLTVSTNTYSALYSRLGGQAIYDDVSDITYIANANYAAGILDSDYVSNLIATTSPIGFEYNTYNLTTSDFKKDINGNHTGSMTAFGAYAFANSISFGGIDNWRVTKISDLNSLFFSAPPNGFNGEFTTTESLFYNIPISDLTNQWGEPIEFYRGGAQNNGSLVSCYYTQGAINPVFGAASLCPQNGAQGDSLEVYALLSTSGDVLPAAIPIPAAAWLFSSALLGLAGVKRRK